MTAELHAEAEPELVAAAEWYEVRREGLGQDFIEEVVRAAEAIQASPRAWAAWPGVRSDLGIRRFVLARFPFSLPYQIGQNRIIILAIAHTRRRPRYWLKRVVGVAEP